jgi:hypothetical protein
MNFMKKVLFSIIAIEGMVLVQLLVLNNWEDMNRIKKSRIMATENKSSSVVFKAPIFSLKERRTLLDSFEEMKKRVNGFTLKSKGLDFLYSKEIHHKMTQSVELYAKKFLNIPYVWGATGPDKFDCSGFTQKIYAKSGIVLPRHSTRQAKVGEYVTYDNLERGDMVFFDTDRKATGVVNHVGIYLEDGKFIHASSGNKKVVITNFNEKPFYRNRFLWGRRVIQDKIFEPIPSLSQKGVAYLFSKLNLELKVESKRGV